MHRPGALETFGSGRRHQREEPQLRSVEVKVIFNRSQ